MGLGQELSEFRALLVGYLHAHIPGVAPWLSTWCALSARLLRVLGIPAPISLQKGLCDTGGSQERSDGVCPLGRGGMCVLP